MAESGVVFHKRRLFALKTAILTAVTVAFIPVLLYRSDLGARVYVGSLVVIHILAIGTFLYGVQKEDVAPSRRGLYGRIAGLVVALALLALAEKGLRTDFGAALFWWSLFAIWALHTAGLALLHLRGRSEQTCIFAGDSRHEEARGAEQRHVRARGDVPEP